MMILDSLNKHLIECAHCRTTELAVKLTLNNNPSTMYLCHQCNKCLPKRYPSIYAVVETIKELKGN